MSSNSLGDPRSGRDRRVPTRKHAFERGTLDPISTIKKPMFTVGNGILLVAIVAYGMYATGHLPQLDAFFDKADQYGKAHNNTVVNGLLTYGTYLFFAVIALLVGLIIFSLVNGHRRRVTDRLAEEVEDRRRQDRRSAPRAPREDMPSLVMPLGKEKAAPTRRSSDPKPLNETPVAAVAVVASPVVTETLAVAPPQSTPVTVASSAPVTPTVRAAPAASIFDGPTSNSAKAAAMAAAAMAEEATLSMPQDMPSFVPMPGKERIRAAKPETRVMGAAKDATPIVETMIETSVTATPDIAATRVAADAPAGSAVADVVAEAAVATAKVTQLKAEAAIAAAKAEAAVAEAKLQVAIAEAVVANAKANAFRN